MHVIHVLLLHMYNVCVHNHTNLTLSKFTSNHHCDEFETVSIGTVSSIYTQNLSSMLLVETQFAWQVQNTIWEVLGSLDCTPPAACIAEWGCRLLREAHSRTYQQKQHPLDVR